MIRKYHNHKPQTTLWHREEELLIHHETPGRQIKQSNQLSLPHQDDCNTRMDINKCTTKHRSITDSHSLPVPYKLGRRPPGPAAGGGALVVLARCSMDCGGPALGAWGINPLSFSSTGFIVGLCLLMGTSAWPCLWGRGPPVHGTAGGVASPGCKVVPGIFFFPGDCSLLGWIGSNCGHS